MMYISRNIGFIILNLQLIIGFGFSFDYLARHLIVNNVAVFAIATFIFSNLTYLVFKGNILYSIKAFFSILISSLIVAVLVMKFNKPDTSFELIHFGLILGYLIIILKLHITTPIAIAIELFLKWKKKKAFT